MLGRACAGVLLLLLPAIDAFYFPGSAPVDYHQGDSVPLHVNSIKRLTWNSRGYPKFEHMYDAYSPMFGFCAPQHPTPIPTSLGGSLFGDRLYSSLFHLSMLESTPAGTCQTLCKTHLTDDQLNNLQHTAIDGWMSHDWLIDGFPVSELQTYKTGIEGDPLEPPEIQSHSAGVPIGQMNYNYETREEGGRTWWSDGPTNYTLYNHYDIKIEYHKPKNRKEDVYRVVGAKVVPKSRDSLRTGGGVDCQAEKGYLLRNGTEAPQGQDVAYTYTVTWEESSTPWATRWDYYLKVFYPDIHVLSLVNSIVIALFLCLVASAVLLRVLSTDLHRYNSVPTEEGLEGFLDNDYGWKKLHGEVARPPQNRMWLSIFVGNGVQLMLMGFVTLVFACAGMLSPANRGALGTCLLVTWTLFAPVAGYVSMTVYLTWEGKAVKKNIFYTAITFPTILFTLLSLVNFWLIGAHSAGAVPFGTFIEILALWFGVSVPLAIFGGWVGVKKGGFSQPLGVNSLPRPIPSLPLYLQPIPCALLAGLLPFGAGFIEFFFLLRSMFGSAFYYAFVYLFFSSIVFCTTVALSSVLVTYLQLVRENYRWQSQSILCGASTGFYLFIYSLVYWAAKLRIQGIANQVLYLSYTGAICTIVGIIGGTVGFLSSAVFVRAIYSRVHID